MALKWFVLRVGTNREKRVQKQLLTRIDTQDLKDKFADEILFGTLVKGGTIHIDAGESDLELQFVPREAP